MSERVAIIVPVYNDQAHLRLAIADLLAQDYKDISIIMVNDGSTDSSGQICEESAKNDSRIRVFHKENGGTGSALNLGFSHVTEKYATWASSDDRKSPQYISKLLEKMLTDAEIGLCFSAYHHQSAGSVKRLSDEKHDANGIVKEYLHYSTHTYISGICFMYNMMYKNMVGEFSTTAGEDYLMAVKLATVSKIAYIDDVLGEWINNPNNLTNRLLKPNHGIQQGASSEAMAIARNYVA